MAKFVTPAGSIVSAPDGVSVPNSWRAIGASPAPAARPNRARAKHKVPAPKTVGGET